MYTPPPTPTHTEVYLHAYTRMHVRRYECTYTHGYIRTHTRTRAHAHSLTHTHIPAHAVGEDEHGRCASGVVSKILISTDAINLQLLNDCVGFNVPFAQVSVAPVVLTSDVPGRGSGSGVRLSGSLKVEAHMYNPSNQSFEPILEPLKLDVTSQMGGQVTDV